MKLKPKSTSSYVFLWSTWQTQQTCLTQGGSREGGEVSRTGRMISDHITYEEGLVIFNNITTKNIYCNVRMLVVLKPTLVLSQHFVLTDQLTTCLPVFRHIWSSAKLPSVRSVDSSSSLRPQHIKISEDVLQVPEANLCRGQAILYHNCQP